MLPQLVNRQIGISKVVNKIKNNEIPSIPIEKLIFRIGTQTNFSTYWKVPIDLLKKTHNKSDNTNVKQEHFKAIDRSKGLFEDGIKDRISAPIRGNTSTQDNMFLINNMNIIS